MSLVESTQYLTGLAAFARLMEAGSDIATLGPRLEARVANNAADAAAMVHIATLAFLTGNESSCLVDC